MNADVIVGVDMGGTSTRVAVAHTDGEILKTTQSGPGNPVRVGASRASQNLRSALEEALGGQRPNIVAACVGMAGVGHPSAAGVIRGAFSDCGEPPVRLLCDDGVIAYWAAFGEELGVLAMAGTGSGVRAQGPGGSFHLGGWGPDLGDEGSAHAIGMAALRMIVRCHDGRVAKTSLLPAILEFLDHPEVRLLPFLLKQGRINPPTLFPVVDREARAGDSIAREILAKAGESLATVVLAAVKRAGLGRGAGAATAGSVLGTSVICREALMAKLTEAPHSLVTGAHIDQPVEGAVRFAQYTLKTVGQGGEASAPQW